MKYIMKNVIRILEKDLGEVKENVEKEKVEFNEKEFMESFVEEVNSKTLNLVGCFNQEMVAYVRGFANQIWYYDEDDVKPLYINISSHGGYISDLLAILDILSELKDEWDCTIITNCNGYAESCGFILWCFGEERHMGRFGELMCHEVSYNWDDNLSGHKRELERIKKCQEKVNKIIMEKTGLTEKQLNKWYKDGDHYIDREEALELNILTVYDE